MTDLSPMIRDAFQDDSLPAADRDRLWSTMQHRQARQRTRFFVRAGLLLLSVVAIVAAVYATIRSSSVPVVPVPVAADSISNFSPVERSMTQETRHEVPSDLIPLLGHRSQLTMDIRSLADRQLELADKLDETTGREHDVISRQLVSLEQQLEATRVAISVIDAQLAGQPVPVVPPVPPIGITEFPPPQVIVNPPISDELIWASGAPLALLALGMIAMLGYMRRIARKTREALTAIERQVASQHTTLASGIDAIAVEVERLGEGQRFMSKVLAGSEAKPAPIART